jgi:hypothetical protein
MCRGVGPWTARTAQNTCKDCGARVDPGPCRGDPPVCAVCQFIQLEPELGPFAGPVSCSHMDRNTLLFRLALVWLAIVPAIFVYALYKSWG